MYFRPGSFVLYTEPVASLIIKQILTSQPALLIPDRALDISRGDVDPRECEDHKQLN